ncbi:MAG TPA: glycerol kinase GlpK [Acidimicrobiales bacterium]|nr:glycerol kinase GlpK [Acidimicrobiales bacterium]
MACVVAVDAGTSGVRTLAVGEDGRVVDVAYRELTQHFPHPGWVEHDPEEIRTLVEATLVEVSARQHEAGRTIAAVGVTNQRETVVAWDRSTGRPRHRALVWQDRRTAATCDRLRAAGHEDLVRRRTGLVLDPYFSATKMAWLLTDAGVVPDDDLVLGTVDSWVIWNLTGGPSGGALVTDPSNASRTLLFDIESWQWSEELCALFGVPRRALAEVAPSCGRLGVVAGDLGSPGRPLHGVPLSGVAGDQQAALFGQACFSPGMAKATYGTGSFVLCNVGTELPAPAEGLLTTAAWDLGGHSAAPHAYALEGSVFVTGAAIQWLRDGLGLIEDAAAIGPLAASVANTEGVYLVPAFTGLGSPWWDPYARGTLVGLSRGIGRAHVARAVVEAIAFQVRDVVDAMRGATTHDFTTLRVDGGASVLELLLQLQADQIRVPVCRPTTTETTALGAATLAGVAEGVWSLEELSSLWQADAEVAPKASQAAADSAHAGWRGAVERARRWVPAEEPSEAR